MPAQYPSAVCPDCKSEQVKSTGMQVASGPRVMFYVAMLAGTLTAIAAILFALWIMSDRDR